MHSHCRVGICRALTGHPSKDLKSSLAVSKFTLSSDSETRSSTLTLQPLSTLLRGDPRWPSWRRAPLWPQPHAPHTLSRQQPRKTQLGGMGAWVGTAAGSSQLGIVCDRGHRPLGRRRWRRCCPGSTTSAFSPPWLVSIALRYRRRTSGAGVVVGCAAPHFAVGLCSSGGFRIRPSMASASPSRSWLSAPSPAICAVDAALGPAEPAQRGQGSIVRTEITSRMRVALMARDLWSELPLEPSERRRLPRRSNTVRGSAQNGQGHLVGN